MVACKLDCNRRRIAPYSSKLDREKSDGKIAQKERESKQIEKEFGYKGKDIRRIVNEMRCQGIPICSCSKGYFYAASVDDINETLAHLKSRIISIQAAQDGMDQSKMMYNKTRSREKTN